MYMTKTIALTTLVILGMSADAFGQTSGVTSTSSASYRPIIAPNSVASGWGSNLSAITVAANNTPIGGQPITLPTTLGNVTLSVKDSLNNITTPLLYLVSPGQITYVLPQATALGLATLTVTSGTNTITGPVLVSNVSPALYTVDGTGTGAPAGTALRVTTSNVVTNDPLNIGIFPNAIVLGASPSDRVYLVLYGTGIRNRSLNSVTATIGGVSVPVQYAGLQSTYPGLDQVNVGPLVQGLVGKGTVSLILTVDGVPANPVLVAFQ